MKRIAAEQQRLRRVQELPEILDAAYGVFELIVSVIRSCEDPADPLFAAFVMAAASAADGRDAVAFAPALPRHPMHAVADGQDCDPATGPEVAAALAGLSELLATRLADAAATAADGDDREACRNAARYARDVRALLAGRDL